MVLPSLMNRLMRALTIISLPIATAHAQRGADVALVRVVSAAVSEDLAPELRESASASTAQGWQVQLPAGKPWTRTRAPLLAEAHGRRARADDTVQFYVRVTERSRSRTTVRFDVSAGKKWRCAAQHERWIFSPRNFDLVVSRDRRGEWRASKGAVIQGEPGPC